MLNRNSGLVVLAVAVALAGCHRTPQAKEGGAVVATLQGEPITTEDLKAELGDQSSADPQAQAQLDAAALSRIIDRKLLAKAASDQKLDAGPQYTAESKRALEAAKASMLARHVTDGLAAPDAAQISQYIQQHPDAFENRRLYYLDRILLPAPAQPIQADADVATLDQLAAVLDKAHVNYERSQTVVDTATAQPDLVKRLTEFAPHQIFEVENGKAISANVIRDVVPAPITGAMAERSAAAQIATSARRQAIVQEVDKLRAAAAREIKYSPGHEPSGQPAA